MTLWSAKFRLKARWQSWKERQRIRLAHWLGIPGMAERIRELQEARRAAIAVDAAMKHDRGYVIMLMPRRGGDLVKVWEIPGGMSMSDQRRFIDDMERRCRGEVSLIDAPYPQKEFIDFLGDGGRRKFQDHVPKGSYPRRGWPDVEGGPYTIGLDRGSLRDMGRIRCTACSFLCEIDAAGYATACVHVLKQLGPSGQRCKCPECEMPGTAEEVLYHLERRRCISQHAKKP